MKDPLAPHHPQARGGPLRGGQRGRAHLRPPDAGQVLEGADLARVDWWGAELEEVTFTGCRFDDADLTEVVTRRCAFTECVLTGARMAGSRHTGTAFLSCRFDRARLFDVVWDGCKLTGSYFPGATLRPLTTTDTDWSWTSLRGVDLSGSDLSAQRFTEADLTDADLRECDLTRADLGRARLQGAKLRGSDLRGASTEGVNWRTLELTGVRVDLVQSVQVARAYGALVTD